MGSVNYNVVLTGFMGTGKSTVGRLLGARLGLEWVDTDALIEERHGPISEIFASGGEDSFRAIERAVAAELAEQVGMVISTGGRMMLDPENAAALGRNGRIFCLVATTEEILGRMSSEGIAQRPLLEGASPPERLRRLMAERAPAYEQFPQVATGNRTPTEIVDDLIDRLKVT